MLRQRLYLVFFVICSWQNSGYCAEVRDFQTWTNITALGSFNKNDERIAPFSYWLETQQRVGDNASRLSQLLLRPGLGYALTTNTSLWLGYAWVYTSRPFTKRPFEENRIWQQLLWIKQGQHLNLMSRTRMEQRFLENQSRVAYRARQLVKIAIPFERAPKFSVISSDELFWHKNNFVGRNSRGFDQNRFFIGIGYKVTSVATFEMGYMNQYIRRVGVPNFLTNILSINCFLNF